MHGAEGGAGEPRLQRRWKTGGNELNCSPKGDYDQGRNALHDAFSGVLVSALPVHYCCYCNSILGIMFPYSSDCDWTYSVNSSGPLYSGWFPAFRMVF